MSSQVYMVKQVGNETPALVRKVMVRAPGEIRPVDGGGLVLVEPLYGGPCMWKFYSELNIYPSEPIPAP